MKILWALMLVIFSVPALGDESAFVFKGEKIMDRATALPFINTLHENTDDDAEAIFSQELCYTGESTAAIEDLNAILSGQTISYITVNYDSDGYEIGHFFLYVNDALEDIHIYPLIGPCL
ncbi:MAG: hypothetical protein KDD40_00460 [Bdellovibrionales bacterium]|nr:hypothetical protein [Bdellovibrionales bacterium]